LTFAVRRARTADAVEIKRLLASLSAEVSKPHIDLNWIVGSVKKEILFQKWFLSFFDQIVVSKKMAILLVAESKLAATEEKPRVSARDIVGICFVISPKWRLKYGNVGIAVRKDWRRLHVGSSLLARALSWAREARLRIVIADVWSTNEASMSFFKSQSFKESRGGEERKSKRARQGDIVYARPRKIRLIRKLGD
jgi:N-acetylglutamate synthase-like GNAT family acetyltransferase